MRTVRAEVIVEVPKGKRAGDAQWDLMRDLEQRLSSFPGILRVRLPDSPEPDITGHVELCSEEKWCKTCKEKG